MDCLNSAYISKNPISRHQIYFYQISLKESCLVYDLLVRIAEKLSIEKFLYLIQKILNFNETVVKLLKNQQFALVRSLSNTVDLSVPIFYYYGNLQLNLIEKLTNPSINCEGSKLNILKSMAITGYKEFISLMTNLQPYWEGSSCILESFTRRFEEISVHMQKED